MRQVFTSPRLENVEGVAQLLRDAGVEIKVTDARSYKKVSRREYLDQMDHLEHLASEGLATLFSQVVYPEVPLHVHHYYFKEEMRWCMENVSLIEEALVRCMKTDQEVWRFYEDDVVAPGSPPRTPTAPRYRPDGRRSTSTGRSRAAS